MPDAFYITLAYVLTWVVVVVYTVYVSRRVRRAEDRLASEPGAKGPAGVAGPAHETERGSEEWT